MLTLERLRGIRVSDLDALDAAGVDRRALAERATRVTAKMVFEDGFFHGDPHPGNLFIEESGRIGLVDFGMVGAVDQALRRRLATLLVAFTATDADALVDALLDLGMAHGPVDRDALRQDVTRLLERYGGAGIGEIPLVAVLEQLLGIVRRHHLRLPRDLALLLKVLVMDQGMAASLAPEFRLEDVLAPYAQRLVQQQYSPEVLGPRVASRAGGCAAARRRAAGAAAPPARGARPRRPRGAAPRRRPRVGRRPQRARRATGSSPRSWRPRCSTP